MKRNKSIWQALTAGLTANVERKLYWYELCPGVAFKAVSLGRTRKRWFTSTEHLIAYRNNMDRDYPYCVIDWIPESQLIERQ